MLFKPHAGTYNVYELDAEEKTLTLWNHWKTWRKLRVIELSESELISELVNVAKKKLVVTVEECDAMPGSGDSLETVDFA